MILAAGTSPAWQRILVLDRLAPGEVHRARGVHEQAGGKPVHVAVASRALGAPATALVPTGGCHGVHLREELMALGVGVCALPVEAPTRICTTLVVGSDATEIVEPAGPMSRSEVGRFMSEFERQSPPDVLVLSGSLAPGVPPTLYRDLTQRARCPVVVDACGPELLLALEARPLVAKPNRAELEVTVGESLSSDAAIHSAMRHLAALGAQWIVVSDGARPLWLLGRDTLCSLRPSSPGRVVNPIGSGDCLAAGIAVGLARGLSVSDAVELGVRAAVSNLQTLLPVRSDTGGLLSDIESASLTFERR